MPDKKVAFGASVGFCLLVALLLLILYYPDQSKIEDDELKEWERKHAVKVGEYSLPTESPSEESSLTELSKTLQDIGISFLVLIAVIFVVMVIGCVACSCCCCL